MPVYRIRDWDENFENYKSRERDACSFLCVPTKRGLGLARVLTETDGLAIFGLFILIAEDCMRQRRTCLFDLTGEDGSTRQVPRRDGWLTDDGKPTGRPWTLSDIALSHRCKESQVVRMIDVMSSESVGWIDVSNANTPAVPRQYPPSTPICKVSKVSKEVSKHTVAKATVGGEDSPGPSFEDFWKEWPSHFRKKGKSKCAALWNRRKLDAIVELIIESVIRHKSCEQWTKEGGQFIPMPSTWLNDEAWDTPTEALKKSATAGLHWEGCVAPSDEFIADMVATFKRDGVIP